MKGELHAVIKKIPTFSIEGKASVDLKGKEKTLAESTEVVFNGDFILSSGIPTTFDAAINTFKQLPSKQYYYLLILCSSYLYVTADRFYVTNSCAALFTFTP